jgi:hypothetical protein
MAFDLEDNPRSPLYPQEVAFQPPGAVSTYVESMSLRALYAWSTVNRPESRSFIRSIAANGLRLRNSTIRQSMLYMPAENIETHISRALKQIESSGSWEINLINVVTSVDEETGRAQVWATTCISMPRKGETLRGREVVSRFKWRYCRRGGRWVWCAYDGLKGSGLNLF